MPEDIAGEPEVQPTPEPEQPQPEAPTREEFEQLARAYMDTNNRLMQAAAYIEALQSAHPEQEDEEEYDEDEGLTPDALQRLVAETVATTLQAQLEQHPAINQVTEQRGAQIANMQLDQIEKQIGKFDRGLAMSLAQAAHSRGYPPEQAVYAGAQEAKRIADQERQAAISEYDEEEGLTPDALQRLVAETVATTLQAQLEQHPAINQVTEQRGAQIANMQLDQIEKQIGKFDRGLAMSLAQAAHSRGYPPEQAVYAGAQEAKRIADQERQAAISEYEQQLKNRLEVPTEPGTRGSATPGQRQAKSYDEVNDNFFARRRAQQALN